MKPNALLLMLGGLLIVPTLVLARPTLLDAELDAISAAGDICLDFFGISGSCVVSITQVYQPGAPVQPSPSNPGLINLGTPLPPGMTVTPPPPQKVTVTKITAKPSQPTPGPIKQHVTVGVPPSFTTVHQRN